MAGQAAYPLPLPAGNYRARYCTRGMQDGSDLDTSQDPGQPTDSYSLAFWPAPPAPDQIVKQTSDIAAYWHVTARSLTEDQRWPTRSREGSPPHAGSGRCAGSRHRAAMDGLRSMADGSVGPTRGYWTEQCGAFCCPPTCPVFGAAVVTRLVKPARQGTGAGPRQRPTMTLSLFEGALS